MVEQLTRAQPIEPGVAITFYSFKGGTGRSMALANVACLLAQRAPLNGDVLMIDWDLEAPGLHHYFRSRLTNALGSPSDLETELDNRPGLLDLMWTLAEQFALVGPDKKDRNPFTEDEVRQSVTAILDQILPQSILKTDVPGLSLLKAGRNDNQYATKVNSMGWENLYHRAPGVFRFFAEWLTARFSYCLVDSRTGLTDVSGICTMLMPEKLVLVFTPNRQSLKGVLDLGRRAIEYRKASGELRALMLYPLPSRIENAESDRKKDWRDGNPSLSIEGYQPLFEKLFRELYGLPSCTLGPYFDTAQIPHIPKYAYGEEIATLVERLGDRSSTALNYDDFTTRLTGEALPWEDPSQIAERLLTEQAVKNAQALYARLSPADQDIARRTFQRLVRPAAEQESGPTSLALPLEDLPAGAEAVLQSFAAANLLQFQPSAKGRTAQFTGEALVRHWPLLQQWLADDRDFIAWRDSLRPLVNQAKQSISRPELLAGPKLFEAEHHCETRIVDLSSAEIDFIHQSRLHYDVAEAQRLADIGLSEITRGTSADSLRRGLLLAAESLRRSPTVQGDTAAREGLALLARPLFALHLEPSEDTIYGNADGHILATLAPDRLRLWDISTGAELARLNRNRLGTKAAVAVSRSGAYAALATYEGELWLYHNQTSFAQLPVNAPAEIKWLAFDRSESSLFILTSTGHIDCVRLSSPSLHRLCVGPNIAGLFVGRQDGWICIQDERGKDCFLWLEESPYKLTRFATDFRLNAVSLSPDRRLVALAGGDPASRASIVEIWDRESATAIKALRQTELVDEVLFGPDSDAVVMLLGRRSIQVVGIQAKRHPVRIRYETLISRLTVSTDAGLLAVAGEDGAARILEFETGRERSRVLHDNSVRYLSFVASGKCLVTAGLDGLAQISSAESQGEQICLTHSDVVWDVAISSDGKSVATGSADNTAAVWTLQTGRKLLSLENNDIVGSVAFSPDDQWFAASGLGRQARLYELSTGRAVHSFQHDDNVPSVVFSPDGRRLLTASWDQTVRVFDVLSGIERLRLQVTDALQHAIFSPDGSLIAAACADGSVPLWDNAGRQQFALRHRAAVRAVAFHPAGTQLATACADGKARVFHLPSGKLLATFIHAPEINGIAYSPDGLYLATAAHDDTARIWDASTGQQVSLVRHTGVVHWVTFTPDGKLLATASDDHTARFWLWQPADLVMEIGHRTRRGLTPDEWAQFLPGEPYRSLVSPTANKST